MNKKMLLLLFILANALIYTLAPFAFAIDQDWNATPQRQWSSSYNATLQDEIVDWTDIDLPTETWDGATVHNGVLWIMDNSKIYYSTDGGSTFTEHCNLPDSSCCGIQILNASDKILCWKTTELWYSLNNGSSWTSGLTPPTGGSFARWSFAMDDLGHIYMGLYGDYTSEKHIIYKSIDYGATWTESWNHTGRHVHDIVFDDYEDRLWAGCGDPYDYGSTPYDTYFMYSDDHGATWINYTTFHKPTAITFTDDYVIYENDDEGQVYRIDKATDTLELTFRGEFKFNDGYAEDMMYDSTNNVVYMQFWEQTPSNHYSIWISPDEGLHWHMVYNTTSFTGQFTEVDSNGYLYLEKGFRFKALTHEEAEHLTFHIWKEGDRPSGESVEFEVAIIDGQNYTLPLYQEPLTDVEVKFEGISFNNLVSNPSFEEGLTDWTQLHGTGGSSEINSTNAYDGTNCTLIKRGTAYSLLRQDISATASHDYLVKGTLRTWSNFTAGSVSNVFISWRNSSGEISSSTPFELKNPTDLTWMEYWFSGTAPATTTTLRLQLQVNTNSMAGFFDALGIIDITNLSEEREYYARALPPIDGGLQNSTNPSISINGETMSYTGQIANTSQTSGTSLTGTLYEDIAINSVSVSGSKIVKVIISGDRIFDAEDMLLLRDQTDLYYATKTYSNPTLTSYDPSILVVYSSVNATLSALSYTSNILTFTVTDTGTSTTYVYCGSNGEPTSLTGATSYSYDSSTTIETITVTHSSAVTLTLDWSEIIPTSLRTNVVLYFHTAMGLLSVVLIIMGATLLVTAYKQGGAIDPKLLLFIFTAFVSLVIGMIVMNAIFIGTGF